MFMLVRLTLAARAKFERSKNFVPVAAFVSFIYIMVF